jgi:hypothetical protein
MRLDGPQPTPTGRGSRVLIGVLIEHPWAGDKHTIQPEGDS